jgi:hypothetical protein
MTTKTRRIYEQDAYYKFNSFHKACNWVATCGVMQQAEDDECYWLLDMVASYIPMLNSLKEIGYLLVIEFVPSPENIGSGGTFTIKDENYPYPLVTQVVEFSYLKKNVKWWSICETAGNYDPKARTVLLLPEEY